jgi:CheY-like chemotaxis protein
MGRVANLCQPRVLIVDDDETVLAVVNDLIQRLGCNAPIAPNGVDPLEILRRNQDVTVLVSDISMPGMNGEGTDACCGPPAPCDPPALIRD